MKFAEPGWLWVLSLVPIIFGLIYYDESLRKKRFAQFISAQLWPVLLPQADWSMRKKKGAIWCAALGFLILALARPQYGFHEESIHLAGMDLLFALDLSNSMEVEDVIPSRLKKAKHLIRTLAHQIEGDRAGLVVFAGSSYVASPLTSDLTYFMDTVEIHTPRMIQSQGTDIGMGLETSLKSLDRGAEEAGGSARGQGGSSLDKKLDSIPSSRAIILISDGEDHEAQALKIAAKLKETSTQLYVIGVGTEKGGPIPLRDESGAQQGLRRDRNGTPIISTFHPGFLKQVAAAAGGKYWDATQGEEEISEIVKELGGLARGDYAERRYRVYEERFQIPLFIALFLLFLEMALPVRRSRSARSQGVGASFSVIALATIFSASFTSALFPASARAEHFVSQPADLDVYLETRKGMEEFQKGNLEEAEKNFGAAQARDPSAPELEFNRGVVQMHQKKTDEAISTFESAAMAAKLKKNPAIQGRSQYNLGKAYTEKGDPLSAAKSYVDAIEAAKQARDRTLEAEARKNLQLLLSNEQKKEKKKDQGQDKNKEENKEKDQNQDKDKKQEKNKDKNEDQKENPDQPKDNGKKSEKDSGSEDGAEKKEKGQSTSEDQKEKNKDKQKAQEQMSKEKQDEMGKQNSPKKPRETHFDSKKMTKEDAERVMAELNNRERELRERLQNKNAKLQNNEKDW
jgi:Ca-activated chloride channel family protein